MNTPLTGYRTECLLSQTPTSSVFAAVNRLTEDPVALKIAASTENNSLVSQEIKVHEHIGRFTAFVAALDGHGKTADGRVFIATRLQEGGTMRNVVSGYKADKLLGDTAAARRLANLLGQYAFGLGLLHRSGVVHCDVKLSNLGVSGTGVGRLIDLGQALNLQEPTPPVMLRGTPRVNIAPEGYAGEISSANDVWALAVVAYYALTLHMPFPVSSEASYDACRHQALAGIQVTPRALNGVLPTYVDAAIVAALDPTPGNRPLVTELACAFSDFAC